MDSSVLTELLSFPGTLEKLMFPSRPRESKEGKVGFGGGIAVDILERPKEYVFYLDVPGMSKTGIQVKVEDERTLVIKSNGKRKREETEEEENCKYVRLERRVPQKLMRKFRLPKDANVSAITAKCEDGVLTVVVEKLPPPPKPRTVEVAIN